MLSKTMKTTNALDMTKAVMTKKPTNDKHLEGDYNLEEIEGFILGFILKKL